jgi:hypothetical protein
MGASERGREHKPSGEGAKDTPSPP